MDHNRFRQSIQEGQQRVQQTWDASVHRFQDQRHRFEQQQLAALGGWAAAEATAGGGSGAGGGNGAGGAGGVPPTPKPKPRVPRRAVVAGLAAAIAVLLAVLVVVGGDRSGGTTQTTADTTPSTVPPTPEPDPKTDDTTTTTTATQKERTTETPGEPKSKPDPKPEPKGKPVPLGDPNAAGLPLEHQSETIGEAATRRVKAYAAERNVSWAAAVHDVIGGVSDLEDERQYRVVFLAPRALEAIRSCLGGADATWASCSAASIASTDELRQLTGEHRYEAISQRLALVDWMAACVNGGERWATCSVRLMGQPVDESEPWSYRQLAYREPAMVDKALECVVNMLGDESVTSRFETCAKAAYDEWQQEEG